MYGNVQRFSFGGAAHWPSRGMSAAWIRADARYHAVMRVNEERAARAVRGGAGLDYFDNRHSGSGDVAEVAHHLN
jgi:hypothetical protein